jgi:aspartokinase-like uncharacterized kinase
MSGAWRFGILQEAAAARPGRPLVVKIGGSLLARPAWPEWIAALVAATHGPRVFVVGGGPVVDGLRAIDAAAPQPAEAMHWLAIEAMGLTARVVAQALRLPLVTSPAGLPAGVLDVPSWLRGDTSLPGSWHVTSDSIAAAAAVATGAGLLLVKSVPPPENDLSTAATAGWVDSHFPVAAADLAHIAWAAPLIPMPAGRSPAGR